MSTPAIAAPRALLPRILKIVASGLLVALIVVSVWCLWLYRISRASLPQLDGSILILPAYVGEGSRLRAEVRVIRDGHGVPHIRAGNLDDLVFAQGYITAQDRLWQMDIMRRVAAGDLAEIQGKAAIEADIQQRTLQMRNAFTHILEALPARERDFLNRYAEGVNAFIASHRNQMPIEFSIMRYRPGPWTALDSLLVTGNLHQYLGSKYESELKREKVLAMLTPEEAQELYPSHSWRDHPPGQDGIAPEDGGTVSMLNAPDYRPFSFAVPRPGWPGSDLAVERRSSTANILALNAFLLEKDAGCYGCFPGSNNWVVSGAHTASGKPLLSNDMHLRQTVPGIWYEAQLTVTGENGGNPSFDVAGVTLPGVPFVIVGHNRRIAWGFTNLGPEVQDVYVENTNAGGDYQTPEGWKPMTYVDEVIHVRGGQDIHLRVPLTRHGPVITRLIPGETRTLALKWTLYDPGVMGFPMYALDASSNWQDFRDALRSFGSPSQNAVYADIDGHIGYQATGAIPLRSTPTDMLPVSGADNAHEWTGYIPFDRLPSVFDPPSGIIATANGRVAPDRYPYPLTNEWFAPYRTQRIYRLLAASPRLRPEDMLKIQTDVYSDLDRFVADKFVYAIDHSPDANARVKQAADLVRGWDGNVGVDSAAATLTVVGRQMLWRLILQGKLGAQWRNYQWFGATTSLEWILGHQPAGWLPATYKDYTALLVAAMQVTTSMPEAPANLAAWKYGPQFPLEFEHPVFGGIPGLRQTAGTGIQPQSGNDVTVKQVGPAFGPSERMTVDFSDLDNSTLNVVMGQSGILGSPYFKDQWSAWYSGTTFKLPFSEASVNAARAHELALEPPPR